MDRKLLLFDVDGILVFNEKIKSQDKQAIIDFQKKTSFWCLFWSSSLWFRCPLWYW